LHKIERPFLLLHSINQFKTLTMTSFAIYIPSVYANITESMISKTFHRMEIGKVKHVEIITNGKANRAHVFFDTMYDNDTSTNLQSEISSGKTSKLAYAKSEHVFWIMLESRRLYDGISNAGEYIENTVEFTEDELAFMDSHSGEPDTSLVDASYVTKVEHELYQLRNAMAQLQMNNQILFNEYNYLLSSSRKTNDMVDKWIDLAANNQMARVRRHMLCLEIGVDGLDEYVPNTSEMTIAELEIPHGHALPEA
jgi:hypothetical protein